MSSDTYSRFCPAARKIERRSVSHAQIQVALLGINAESRRSRNHRHLAFAATSLSKQVEVASTINFAFPSLIPSTILLDERLQPANATRIAHVSGDGGGMAWPREVTADGRSTTGVADRSTKNTEHDFRQGQRVNQCESVPREGNVMLSKYQGFVDDQQGEHNEMIKRHYEVLSHSVGEFLVQRLICITYGRSSPETVCLLLGKHSSALETQTSLWSKRDTSMSIFGYPAHCDYGRWRQQGNLTSY